MKLISIILCLVFVMNVNAQSIYGRYTLQEKKVTWSLSDANADLKSGAAGVVNIFSVPAKTAILGVFAHVNTAISGATAAIVGDGDNDDGWIADGFGTVESFYPEATYAGAYVATYPKYYADADTIDMTLTGTATTGDIDFVVRFMVFE